MAQFSGRKLYAQIAKTRETYFCRFHNFNIYQKPTTKNYTKQHINIKGYQQNKLVNLIMHRYAKLYKA